MIKTLTIIHIEGKTLPTELRKMDKGSKEDFGYDQAQEGKHTHNYEKEHFFLSFFDQLDQHMRTTNMLVLVYTIQRF